MEKKFKALFIVELSLIEYSRVSARNKDERINGRGRARRKRWKERTNETER